jgi:RNA polymerase sigma factor (sigma-70 family)
MPDTVRLAFLLCGDQAMAEDAGHEAFLRVVAKWPRLRDPAAVTAYLHRAVVNEVRARQRSLARQAGREARALAGRGPAPSATEQVDQRLDLFEALHTLPLRQRTAILLRYWLDLSDGQIAQAMDCPVGTVKSALSRGLDALRRAEAGGEGHE